MRMPPHDPCPLWRVVMRDRCIVWCAMIIIACCAAGAVMGYIGK